ncbi:uncharacterized membrane protein YraQ (UPF0718 family) [Scopulibacillus daqui]|uniref:Uncharacterized membrane protein YraQ (UPF0718 family) n=1 Tax=Scopulibacillus daqui TaxID=1469162 RepID=A0ABS2PX36_9BACL|nr:permease [Scopulibacillus daqui]MBM7644623.1 uncharacterized membrane protein YraQ (UPF0718 family) [Scopulibacillus daqui]
MLSQSLLQMNTIFISLLIEAVPFVVVGVFISALIELFVTEEMITKVIPKNRFLSVTMGTCIGSLFPGCECGIVPITQRLVKKRVPLHAAIAFMLTGPIINPIVIFSTYIAFGNSWKMVFYRCGLAICVSFVVGIIISFLFREDQLREYIYNKGKKHQHHDHHHHHEHDHRKMSFIGKVKAVIDHAIDEFFSVGKFLVIGSLIASAMQTFIKTSTLLSMGNTKVTAILVMILLAFILSVCSEADAFIAASFRNTFPIGPLTAFLVFGAMVDMKNLIMMLSFFKKKFVLTLVLLIFVCVFTGALFI